MIWIVLFIVYILIGVLLLWDCVRKDYGGNMALFPLIYPMILFGYPILVLVNVCLWLYKWLREKTY